MSASVGSYVRIVCLMLPILAVYMFIAKGLVLIPGVYIGFAIFYVLLNVWIEQQYGKEKNQLIYLFITVGFSISLGISSAIMQTYNASFLSPEFVSKVILLVLLLATGYLTYIVMAAKYSYQQKKKNQRITKTPAPTTAELTREAKQRLASDEVYFVLGIDVDNDDRE